MTNKNSHKRIAALGLTITKVGCGTYEGGSAATQMQRGASKLERKGMAMRRHLGVMLIAGMWAAWVAIPCSAQSKPASNPAPCSVEPQPDPCGTTPAPSSKPSTKEKFPFPGEVGGTPDPALPSISGAPQTPDAAGATSSPAPKSFPFPGDASKPDASTGASSSSSSSGDDATPIDPSASSDSQPGATPGLKDEGSEGKPATPGRHILHRVNPVGTKLQTNDEREQEDLDVAHFYVQSGDLQGAYLRSQDAVKIAPDDADAHFALAEIAMKLNKRDEAIAEYNACLKLDPSEKQAKDARKALARLKP